MVYGYGYSPFDRRVGFARNNFSRPIQTREVMVRNDDAQTPIWAVEYGWVSLPDDWAGQPSPWGKSVSEEKQADYLVDGYFRAQQEWPWMGVMAVWAFRFVRPPDDPAEVANPTRGFAIVNYDFSPRPAYEALSAVAPALQRDFTGSYELTEDQQASLVAGDPLVLHIWGERLDLEAFGPGDVEVAVDGQAPHTRHVPQSAWATVTAASGLADGPHDIEIRLVTQTGVQAPAVAGYVVSRRPLETWIHPWIVAALLVALALMFASCVWALRDVRRIRAWRIHRAHSPSDP